MVKIQIIDRTTASQDTAFRVYSSYVVHIRGVFDAEKSYSVGVYNPADLTTPIALWAQSSISDTKLVGVLSFNTDEAGAYVTNASKDIFLYIHNETDDVDFLSMTTQLHYAPNTDETQQSSASSSMLSALKLLDDSLAGASVGDIITVAEGGSLTLGANAGDVASSIGGAEEQEGALESGFFAVLVGDVLKKITWANVRATLKTYFDELYCIATNYANVLNVGSDYLHGIRSGIDEDSLTFDNSTHVLTISDAHVYYYKGTAKSVSANNTCDLDDFTLSSGLWYVYYTDASGTLTASQTPWSLAEQVPVATVFWYGSAGRVAYEAHSSTRDIDWHTLHHNYIGAAISPGDFAITAPASGTGSSINIAGGTVADEDLRRTHGTITSAVVWFQTSAIAYGFETGSAVYGSSVRFVDSANSYTLSSVGSSKYINVWGYANTDTSDGVYTFLETRSGGTGYNTVRSARDTSPPDLAGMGLTNEIRLIYRWIYKGDGTWMETTDYRNSEVLPGGGGTSSPTAAGVSFVPAGNIAATNVQAALEELDDEKAQTEDPSTSVNVGGAAVQPDFASTRTLVWALTSNLTSFALATNLPDQCCEIQITPGAYTLPSDPPSTAIKGAWDVSGTYVRITIEQWGESGQIWTADSAEVVA